MKRVLAISDEKVPTAYAGRFEDLSLDLVVACGDLPFEYLEYVVTVTGVPLLYVPGNHDPELKHPTLAWPMHPDPLREPPGARGCTNIDGRIVTAAGLRVAGLGGSMRYREGPHQYTEAQMARRARGLGLRHRLGRMAGAPPVTLVIAHSPPRSLGDGDDLAHRGFETFVRLIDAFQPLYFVHGHIHPHTGACPDRTRGNTLIVNAVGHRLLEVDTDGGMGSASDPQQL